MYILYSNYIIRFILSSKTKIVSYSSGRFISIYSNNYPSLILIFISFVNSRVVYNSMIYSYLLLILPFSTICANFIIKFTLLGPVLDSELLFVFSIIYTRPHMVDSCLWNIQLSCHSQFFWHYLIIVNIDKISIGGIIINFLYICVKYSSYVGSWTLTLKILLQYLIHYLDINFAFRMFQYLCFLLNSIIWIIIWLSQVFILISYYSPEFLSWLLSLLYFNYLLLIGILIILKSSP